MSYTAETLLRHWQTLRLIPRHPRKITATELCGKLASEGFSIGKRSVERDLQALSAVFPLTVDDRSRPFGWSWDKDAPAFDLPGLTASESLTLLMAKQYLSSVMPSSLLSQLAPHFRQAEKKLEGVGGKSGPAEWMHKVRMIPPTQALLAPTVDEEIQATLQEALLLDRQCLIKYQRRDATRVDEYPISPLGLVERGSLLYLICTIKTYSDIRILVLHRVNSAELLDTSSLHPEGYNLDAYLASGAFGWGKGESIFLEASFSPLAGNHLHETPLAPDQTITVQEDGRLLVTASVGDTQQLQWWLLGFGGGVEVHAPAHLRERIRQNVSQMAASYGIE